MPVPAAAQLQGLRAAFVHPLGPGREAAARALVNQAAALANSLEDAAQEDPEQLRPALGWVLPPAGALLP